MGSSWVHKQKKSFKGKWFKSNANQMRERSRNDYSLDVWLEWFDEIADETDDDGGV